MKSFGITLLVVGFVWIAYDVAAGFTEYQYVQWLSQSQNLPAGETIKRQDAIRSMRELSLDLKSRHRVIFAPALLMMAGGLVAGFSQRQQQMDTPRNE